MQNAEWKQTLNVTARKNIKLEWTNIQIADENLKIVLRWISTENIHII